MRNRYKIIIFVILLISIFFIGRNTNTIQPEIVTKYKRDTVFVDKIEKQIDTLYIKRVKIETRIEKMTSKKLSIISDTLYQMNSLDSLNELIIDSKDSVINVLDSIVDYKDDIIEDLEEDVDELIIINGELVETNKKTKKKLNRNRALNGILTVIVGIFTLK
tara:strand:- start:178 stop:663 length:486 start_codon:yes stop_codon:yes gene_type:complete